MRTIRHRSVASFVPASEFQNNFNELIGHFSCRPGGIGWTQELHSPDGGYISVNCPLRFDESQALRLRRLMDALDQAFPFVFDLIEKSGAPFSDFLMNDLELNGIYVDKDHVYLEFDSDACSGHRMCPSVKWDGEDFGDVSWDF